MGQKTAISLYGPFCSDGAAASLRDRARSRKSNSGSADFSDIGHILYSVEPYQNVFGCNDPPGTPNGQLIDSTNDVLSHELSETISDPDGDAWWNATPSVTGLQGEEIGDECVFITPPAFGDPSVFTIGHHLYAVQLEYSNSAHGCAGTP
jgi:hypothetical protein